MDFEEVDSTPRHLLRGILDTEPNRSPVTRSTSAQNSRSSTRQSARLRSDAGGGPQSSSSSARRSARNNTGALNPQEALKRKLRESTSARISLPVGNRRTTSHVTRKSTRVSALQDDDVTPRHILKNILQTEPEVSLLFQEKAVGKKPVPESTSSMGSSRPSSRLSDLEFSSMTLAAAEQSVGLKRKRPHRMLDVTAFEKRLNQEPAVSLEKAARKEPAMGCISPSSGLSDLELSNVTMATTDHSVRRLRRNRSPRILNVTNFERRLNQVPCRVERNRRKKTYATEDIDRPARGSSPIPSASTTLSGVTLSLKTPHMAGRTEKKTLQRKAPRHQISVEAFEERLYNGPRFDGTTGGVSSKAACSEDFTLNLSEYTTDLFDHATTLYAQPTVMGSTIPITATQDKATVLASQIQRDTGDVRDEGEMSQDEQMEVECSKLIRKQPASYPADDGEEDVAVQSQPEEEDAAPPSQSDKAESQTEEEAVEEQPEDDKPVESQPEEAESHPDEDDAMSQQDEAESQPEEDEAESQPEEDAAVSRQVETEIQPEEDAAVSQQDEAEFQPEEDAAVSQQDEAESQSEDEAESQPEEDEAESQPEEDAAVSQQDEAESQPEEDEAESQPEEDAAIPSQTDEVSQTDEEAHESQTHEVDPDSQLEEETPEEEPGSQTDDEEENPESQPEEEDAESQPEDDAAVSQSDEVSQTVEEAHESQTHEVDPDSQLEEETPEEEPGSQTDDEEVPEYQMEEEAVPESQSEEEDNGKPEAALEGTPTKLSHVTEKVSHRAFRSEGGGLVPVAVDGGRDYRSMGAVPKKATEAEWTGHTSAGEGPSERHSGHVGGTSARIAEADQEDPADQEEWEDEENEMTEDLSMKTPAFIRTIRKGIVIKPQSLPAARNIQPSVEDVVSVQPKKRTAKTGGQKKKEPPSIFTKSYCMGNFKHFAKTKVSPDVYPVLKDTMEKFFDRMVEDLETYANHAKRKTIEVEDVVLLLKRQGHVTDKVPVEVLIEKYLDMGARKQLIPCASSGNVVFPKSLP